MIFIKLWIDDVRPAPKGYVRAQSVNGAIAIIEAAESCKTIIEIIDIDHDAGDFGPPDYIKVLDWLEETGRNYPIRLHSLNPVGIQNMRRIITKNGWREVK